MFFHVCFPQKKKRENKEENEAHNVIFCMKRNVTNWGEENIIFVVINTMEIFDKRFNAKWMAI